VEAGELALQSELNVIEGKLKALRGAVEAQEAELLVMEKVTTLT
jgi:hypothetical protein